MTEAIITTIIEKTTQIAKGFEQYMKNENGVVGGMYGLTLYHTAVSNSTYYNNATTIKK